MKNTYFDISLYKKVQIKSDDFKVLSEIRRFFDFKGVIDGYNPQLNENTTFKIQFFYDNFSSSTDIENYLGVHKCELNCVRSNFQIIYYFLLEEIDNGDTLYYQFQKIGQYPTIADLEIGKHKRYTKIISKQYLSELNKAIGLSANGVGVGSFVYLRRVFENLIEKYHLIAKNNNDWDEEKYNSSRISDKIELLKDFLPAIVVKYRKVYSIMSKGIHELKENECLEYFPIIKDAIISMLEQDYLKTQNEIKQNELEKNINSLVSKLK